MIYLDYHSTTPCDKRVVDVMLPYFTEHFGNPSSVHDVGLIAKDAVEDARHKVAKIIGARPDWVYFTSGATESNNIVIQSVPCLAKRIGRDNTKPCIITTNSEHSSVRDPIVSMFNADLIDVYYLKIDYKGNIDLDELDEVLSAKEKNYVLVSIIAANNEIGTIHDLKSIGKICNKHKVVFHTDATQAIGKTPIDVQEMNICALSMSAHKIYGPKGIGAVYLENNLLYNCLLKGGSQEDVSSGTINVPGVVGFGKACELMEEEKFEKDFINKLRETFLEKLKSLVHAKDYGIGIEINGSTENRLYNNLNITIKGVEAKTLILGMDDICISTGSACASGEPRTSHVINALGIDEPENAVRISFGRCTTLKEIEYAVHRMSAIINSVRNKNDQRY